MRADDGQVGWGEAVTMWPEASWATKAIVDGMAPLLIGRDPAESDRLWRSLKEHAWWYGVGGIASFAIAALDIAIWDLKGKALGCSVLDLLGGAVKDRIPAIVSCHASRAEIPALVNEMAGSPGWVAASMGIKIGFGKRGDARLGYEHGRDVAFMSALRAALGPDKAIMIDIGNADRWDVSTAVARVRAMEQFDLAWIEEPLGPDDPLCYATLRAKTTTRTAYGEREWTAAGYRRILDSGTVDVVGVDPGRAEGITGFRQVCAAVEAAHLQANAHAWSSAIVTAASLAVSFSTPVCRQFKVKPSRIPCRTIWWPDPSGRSEAGCSRPAGRAWALRCKRTWWSDTAPIGRRSHRPCAWRAATRRRGVRAVCPSRFMPAHAAGRNAH